MTPAHGRGVNSFLAEMNRFLARLVNLTKASHFLDPIYPVATYNPPPHTPGQSWRSRSASVLARERAPDARVRRSAGNPTTRPVPITLEPPHDPHLDPATDEMSKLVEGGATHPGRPATTARGGPGGTGRPQWRPAGRLTDPEAGGQRGRGGPDT